MKIGYGRVSDKSLNARMQAEALRQAGCARVYIDQSGRGAGPRVALNRCLKSLQAQDTLVVWSLGRLGHSVGDLADLLDALRARGIAFLAIEEHFDTATPAGRMQVKTVRMLAEMQRMQRAETSRAARAAAVAGGVRLGRRPALSRQDLTQVRQLVAQGMRPEDVAQRYNLSTATIYRALNRAARHLRKAE